MFKKVILEKIEEVCQLIEGMDQESRIDVLNQIKKRLHDVSPFKNEPVDCVLWIKADLVHANDYNPNRVAPPEMRLLKHSIMLDGYTQPIVAFNEGESFEVVDGFHRSRVGKEYKAVRDRVLGYLPLTIINEHRTDRKDRIAATIRHNRARGVHCVVPMTDIVAELIRKGWTDEEVAEELGMDADEVLRFKQCSGLPELFKNHEYSRAWE